MASRPSWDGFLRFNLISVPVKAYSAAAPGGGKIGFHLIHKKCHSPIRYQKVCPIHGEVNKDEIVSGYEFTKGKYVIIEPGELDKLRTENDKTITIDVFVRPDELDPLYFSGRTYYLLPDGRVAEEPYAVLQRVMEQENRYGIAQVVFAGRGQVVAVRPAGRLLAMSMLSYADQVKKPAAFEDDLPRRDVPAQELKLARTLIEASTTQDFDFERYKDAYTTQLVKLLEAKAKGKKIVAARSQEAPAVINLMDALRQSLHQAQRNGSGKGRAPKKAPRHKPARPSGRRRTG